MIESHDILFLSLKQKDDKIELEINCQNTNPNIHYIKAFSLNDLQKISKYFLIFDSIDECFSDLKNKFDQNNYEINLDDIDKKINIKFKTNILKKDFSLEIPINTKVEKNIYSRFIYNFPNTSFNKDIKGDIIKIQDYKYIENIEKKIKDLENLIKEKNDDNILFEKSTIIKNNFERKLLESFIKDNDKTKKDLNPVLLFKATVDGDNSQTFHKKCDLLGATLTIVQNEQGKRFGGYTSICWDQRIGGYCNKGFNFIFSLDTRKYYTNTTGNYHTYHNNSYGPTFGNHDLYISSGCLSNQSSYVYKNSYDTTSACELNAGTQYFKVVDYEVFQI
jgi:hypothetical protein